MTPRAPQSATFCRTRLTVETFKEDLHQPPHPRRRIVPNIRMFQVSLFVSTANCPKETGPPSVVTLKTSSSYMLQIITGWKPPCRGSVSTLERYTVIFSWWWLVLQHIPGIYAWVERTEFASRPSLKLSAPFTGYVGYQSVLILLAVHVNPIGFLFQVLGPGTLNAPGPLKRGQWRRQSCRVATENWKKMIYLYYRCDSRHGPTGCCNCY